MDGWMDGRTDGCRWLNLLVMGATVCAASNNALMHSFSLVLLPGAQLVWLALVGVWGTLQHRWLTEEAPSFALFLSEILHGLTPLLSPPLLTWGALAAQIVAVNHTAFCLAALCPLHTIYFATPSKGIARLGRSEAQVLAATGVLLPALVHVSIHYQLLGLPSYGSGGLVLSALSAVVFRSGGESLSSDDLDDAQTDRINTAFQVLALRGVTVVTASGDGGSHWTFGPFPGAKPIALALNKIGCGVSSDLFPASSPYLLAIGGTVRACAREYGCKGARAHELPSIE